MFFEGYQRAKHLIIWSLSDPSGSVSAPVDQLKFRIFSETRNGGEGLRGIIQKI